MNCLHLFRFVAMTSASGVPEGNRESPAKADGSLAIMPRLTAGTTPSIAPNVAGARCPWLRCIIGIAFVGGGLSNLSAAASEERSRSIRFPGWTSRGGGQTLGMRILTLHHRGKEDAEVESDVHVAHRANNDRRFI